MATSRWWKLLAVETATARLPRESRAGQRQQGGAMVDQGKPQYWDDVAAEYDTEILSSYHSNVNNTIKNALDTYAPLPLSGASAAGNAVDFGCGVGKYLPALTGRFERVVGMDFSSGLVEKAKAEVLAEGMKNVEVFRVDLTVRSAIRTALSSSVVGFEPVRFAVCTNVLLAPSDRARRAILKNLYGTVGEGGAVLLVVPSRESAEFVDLVFRRWQGDEAARREGLVRGRKDDIVRGLLNRGETLTKHYIKEEIILECEDVGFAIESIAKSKYGWDTEFEFSTKRVPKKVANCAPPWDWLLMLRK